MQQKKTKNLLKKINVKYERKNLQKNNFTYIFSPTKNKRKSKSKKHKFSLIIAGSLMGFLNGFFGGGGGMVCVPILQKVLGLDAKHSHATAIMIIFPLSLISAIIYVFNGYITTEPLLSVGAGVVIGGILGSFALKILPPKTIRIIFAVIMFAGGIKLII